MITTDDRLTELRQQLSETVARLAELDAAAIAAVVDGKGERDISAIETRKSQARERVVLLQRTIKQLEYQQQLDAQKVMLAETVATIAPLVAPLDEAAAKLALPLYDKPTHPLEPPVVKPKQTGRWFGAPRQGTGRWNERLR